MYYISEERKAIPIAMKETLCQYIKYDLRKRRSRSLCQQYIYSIIINKIITMGKGRRKYMLLWARRYHASGETSSGWCLSSEGNLDVSVWRGGEGAWPLPVVAEWWQPQIVMSLMMGEAPDIHPSELTSLPAQPKWWERGKYHQEERGRKEAPCSLPFICLSILISSPLMTWPEGRGGRRRGLDLQKEDRSLRPLASIGNVLLRQIYMISRKPQRQPCNEKMRLYLSQPV